MNHKPDFFIVGAHKCGTTALFRYLGAYPGVCQFARVLEFLGLPPYPARKAHCASRFARNSRNIFLPMSLN